MATPRALPIWTLLLGCGQVLPPILVLAGLLGLLPASALAPAALALGDWADKRSADPVVSPPATARRPVLTPTASRNYGVRSSSSTPGP